MKWSIGAKISSGFALGLAILVVLGVISYRDSTGLIASADWVTHTYQVLTRLNGISNALVDVETAERGFVITGVDVFLEPYTAGTANVGALAKEVRQLTSDNPAQQKRLDALEPLIATRLDMAKAQIDTRRTNGFKAAQDMVASGQGKKVMDEIRQVVAAMVDEENGLLKERDAASKARAGLTVSVILYGIPVAFVLLAVVALLLVRSISIPLRAMAGLSDRVAAGDLTVNVPHTNRRDEIGVLQLSLSRMAKNLS